MCQYVIDREREPLITQREGCQRASDLNFYSLITASRDLDFYSFEKLSKIFFAHIYIRYTTSLPLAFVVTPVKALCA